MDCNQYFTFLTLLDNVGAAEQAWPCMVNSPCITLILVKYQILLLVLSYIESTSSSLRSCDPNQKGITDLKLNSTFLSGL